MLTVGCDMLSSFSLTHFGFFLEGSEEHVPADFSWIGSKISHISCPVGPTDFLILFLLQGSQKDQKKIQKTMSSGDLGKVEVLRKTSSQDGR